MSLTCNTIDNRISVDGEFKTVHGEFKAVDGEFETVHGEFKQVRRDIAGLGERLARVEGHLTAPGGFTLPRLSRRWWSIRLRRFPVPAGAKLGSGRQAEPPVVVDPPPEIPSAGWRQAG